MKVLIPVAWPYANGPRHLGHVAGFGVPSDVFARYQRMLGNEVLMVSGTDEHGTPIVIEAESIGMEAEKFADKNNEIIVEDLKNLGLTYNLFTRTTTQNHYNITQEIFSGLYQNGYIIKQVAQVAISPSTKRTLPDRYIFGTCPKCGYDKARGDQCENCGNQMDPDQLIDPKTKKSDGTLEIPEFMDTEHFFLDLPKLKEKINSWLDSKKDWRPNVIKYAKGMIDEAEPRAITRDLDWGIPIPLDEYIDEPNKKIYVWFDAVIGYLSASIEWARRFGKSEDQWKEFWQDDTVPSYYFMGKDNIVFHSVIWPGQLLGYAGRGDIGGKEHDLGVLNLPSEIVSSEFLTMNDAKFSTSQGNVIYVKDFLRNYQPDALRFYLEIAGPESGDANFTWDDFFQRINSELVGNWGNLVNRTLNLTFKKLGTIPNLSLTDLDENSQKLLENVNLGFKTVGELLNHSKIKLALTEFLRLSALVNTYLAQTEPWKLDTANDEENKQLQQILWTALQAISNLSVISFPFIPFSARQIHLQLGFQDTLFDAQPEIQQVPDLDKDKIYSIITGTYQVGVNLPKWEPLPILNGTQLSEPQPIFTKLDSNIDNPLPN